MLRPTIQDAVAHQCADVLWAEDKARRVCPGVYQTPQEHVVLIVGAAALPPAALAAARECRFLDSVAVEAGRHSSKLLGPRGAMFDDEWQRQLLDMHTELAGLEAALLNIEVWTCDTNVEWACLLLGAPQIRVAFSEVYGEDVPEEQLRELLAQNRSPYPGILDRLLDEEVSSLMKEVS